MVPTAEEFGQLTRRLIDLGQHDYEVSRPGVHFSGTITERTRQTRIERVTMGDEARRFVQEGMLGW